MKNVSKLIEERRSVRTYLDEEIKKDDIDALLNYLPTISNPFNAEVEFKLLEGGKYGLKCPVITGTDTFLAGKIKRFDGFEVAFGYIFEKVVLYALSLNLGTVWIGGTFNRSAFESAMELKEDEAMPCATPIGYIAKKMSVKEKLMRTAVKADSRLPFDKLFFKNNFDTPLSEKENDKFVPILKCVNLAPSAVNKQPWRVVVDGDRAHFYIKVNPNMSHGGINLQKVDLGIALCHFDLKAEEDGYKPTFSVCDPDIPHGDDLEYIASYTLKPSGAID